MSYVVKCADCTFQAEEENPKIAMALRDMHDLYNYHDVETLVKA